MNLILEVTKADGAVTRSAIDQPKVKLAAAAGDKIRILDAATGKAPAGVKLEQNGDDLAIQNLPEGRSVEITDFYADCAPGQACSLTIDPADGGAVATLSGGAQPAVSADGQPLLYAQAAQTTQSDSSGGAAPSASGGAAAGGVPSGVILGGLAVGGLALAAGGGSSGDDAPAEEPPPTEPPATEPPPTEPPTDTTAPAAPVIAALAEGTVVNAAEAADGVTVTGTAEAGSTVAVTWGATTLSTTADASGAWTVAFTDAQVPADGSTTISAVATDASGNASEPGTLAVGVDTATSAPVIAELAEGAAVNAEEAADGVTVTGTAEAESTVAVTWGATTLNTTADASGAWTVGFTDAQVPADGSTTISAVATDAAGNASEPGTLAVDIDTLVPDAPSGTVGRTGTVTGTAEAGTTVSLIVGGEVKATATADSLGEFRMPQALESGATGTLTATDAAGNTSTGLEVTADIYMGGTVGDDTLVGGSADFMTGGDGNDVLIGGTGGNVRNYQFEFWNTEADGAYDRGDATFAVFSSAAQNGWTIGALSSTFLADGSVEQVTGSGFMEIVSNDLEDPDGLPGTWPDDTGGGAQWYWETAPGNGAGGSSISQSVITEEGAQYNLIIQMNNFDGDASMSIWWNGEEIWSYDGISGVATGQEPGIFNLSDTRQDWVWQVEGAAGSTTSELEIRSYETVEDSLGRRIDRVVLDPVVADGSETIEGGVGSDLLFGQQGDDTLYGGEIGPNNVTGDGAADVFVYTMRVDNGNDVIKDFEVGVDTIHLIDALDTYAVDSGIPGDVTNSDLNLTYRDFFIDDSASQYLTLGDEGGSLRIDLFGMGQDGQSTAVGSVVLEGVDSTAYSSVEDLFSAGIVSATMDGLNPNILSTVV